MRRVRRRVRAAPAGRVVDVSRGPSRGVIRAVRDRSRRVSGAHRVRHRYVNGRRHLAQHGEHGDQPPMGKSDHAPSVSLPTH